MKCDALAMKLVLWTVATMGLAFMIAPTLKMLVSYVKVSLCMNQLSRNQFKDVPIYHIALFEAHNFHRLIFVTIQINLAKEEQVLCLSALEISF